MAVDPEQRPTGARRAATDVEARALASAVRMRILRICLDAPHTNAEIAQRLERNPASVLHHVRTLANAGFLEALPVQRGQRGSRPRPYRATGKSWQLSTVGASRPMVETFLAGISDLGPTDLDISRLGLRLDQAGREELAERLQNLLDDFAARPSPPHAEPWSVFVAVHPDPDRR